MALIGKSFKSVVFLLMFVVMIHADDSTSVKWLWEGLHMFNLEVTSQNAADLKDDNGYSDIDWGSFYIQLPVYMKKGSPFYFGAGLIYNQYHLDYAGPGIDTLNVDFKSKTAHGLKLLLGFNYRFGGKNHLYWEYNGGVDGWFNNVGTDHINHLLFAYLGRKPRKNLYFRLGIAGSYSFKELLILPLVGVSVGFNDHLAFELMFPSHVMLRAKINDRFETGTKISIPIKDAGCSVADEDIKVSFQQLNGGVYFDTRIIKTLTARAEGGIAFWREKVLTLRGDETGTEVKPGVTPYIRFSLRWQV